MASVREVIYEKLQKFYQRYDPSKLKGNRLDKLCDYALAEGIEALNEGLMRKYGDYLDSGSDEYLLHDGYNERDSLRLNLEIYYVVHDPSKLNNPEDLDAILEWAMYHGVERLNDKLRTKYEADLFDVSLDEAQVVVQKYYEQRNIERSDKEIKQLIDWAVDNGFVALNQRFVDKYGVAIGETKELSVEEQIRQKLGQFYASYDPEKLDDKDNMNFVVSFVMKNGEQRLNERLQKKYGANLYTMPPKTPSKQTRESTTDSKLSKNRNVPNKDDGEEELHDDDIAAVVEADEKKIERIRNIVEIFYGKHDPNRLLQEGVSPIIQYALVRGEESLNEKLKGKYNEDLIDIEEQYENVKRKLKRFYTMYDPSKIVGESFERNVGRATILGIGWLNDRLMKKYDDDTDFTGLKQRIRLFYQRVGSEKTEVQVSNIADWALEKGLDKLNKKMKKKYGISLEDVYLVEAPVEEQEIEEEIEEEEEDDVRSEDLQLDIAGNGELNIAESEKTIEAFAITEEDERILDGIAFDLEDDDAGRGRSSFLAIEEEDEEEEKQVDLLSNNLVQKIQAFYRKHDPDYGSDLKNIRADTNFILEYGVDSYNARLMTKYGESLRSVLGRKRTLAKFKKDQLKAARNSKDQNDSTRQSRKSRNKSRPEKLQEIQDIV